MPVPRRPERLRPDNVTPPTRTPWGGRRIAAVYKPCLRLADNHPVVGESWEVSVEPSFPSVVEATGATLAAAIAADPVGWLGPEAAAAYGGQLPLLVKLLDAGENLSVQVHPAAGDPGLGPGESGKPEAWIILDADPGAGIYLGWRDGVTRAAVERCLDAGGRLDELLNFVPVRPGDAFVVDAGTVHAIGGGVTLVEPQHVTPGKRGVTYRFWDWNRRYDDAGRPDPRGRPRPLHRDRALAVTDWDAPRGAALVARCRARPARIGAATAGGPTRSRLLATPWFEVERWVGRGKLEVAVDRFHAATCVGGAVTLAGPDGAARLRRGESAVVPAATGRLEMVAEEADVVVCRV